jgi:uncharacterized protein (TIGR02145 family)
LVILFVTSCQKQMSSDKINGKTADGSSKGADKKIDICHKGQMISISQNAWPAHQAHGDVTGNCSPALPVLTTTICNQTWMVKNLDVDHYRNGDHIPQVTDPTAWASLTTGAWCYYFNDASYGPVYGKLYNWYAVNDPRGLAPAGWHVPSYEEWESLINCLGGEYVAGGKLKETGTTHWLYPNVGATNETGFTALPGNIRFPTGGFSPSTTTPFLGISGDWWTSSEYVFNSIVYARHKYIVSHSGSVQNAADVKNYGFSVRCIKD